MARRIAPTKRNRLAFLGIVVVLLFAQACDSTPDTESGEDQACFLGYICDPGLECLDLTCRDPEKGNEGQRCFADQACRTGWFCKAGMCVSPLADGDEESEVEQDADYNDHCTTSGDCPDGKCCRDFRCVYPDCESASDCAPLYGRNCWVCEECGICTLQTCMKSSDCSCARAMCLGGECMVIDPPDCSYTISVDYETNILRQGKTFQLKISMFNSNGAKVEVPMDFYPFTITSSDPKIVEVHAYGSVEIEALGYPDLSYFDAFTFDSPCLFLNDKTPNAQVRLGPKRAF